MDENTNLLVDESVSNDNGSVESATTGVPTVYVVNDTYTGTISDTYLDFFEGIVHKLAWNEHYLIWRTGQYDYAIAYGTDLTCDGYVYSGAGLWVTTISRDSDSYNAIWSVSHTIDDIRVDTSNLFAYSDIGDVLPTVQRGWTSLEASCFCLAFFVMFLYIVLSDIFKYVKR